MLKFGKVKATLKVKEERVKAVRPESKLGKPDPNPTGEALKHRVITKKLARIWGLPIKKSKLKTYPGSERYWSNMSWYTHSTREHQIIIGVGHWNPTSATHIMFKIFRTVNNDKLRIETLNGLYDRLQAAEDAFSGLKRAGLVPK